MSTALYAGPGKVNFNSKSLQPDGENGEVKLTIGETTTEVASAMFGKIGEQISDQTVTLTTKPFDRWELLGTLFPARIGVKVGSTAAALVIGGRPHGASNVPAYVYTADSRLYTVVRAAVTGHPSMHLGIGKALFGDVTITGLGDTNTPVAMGASGYLISGNAITESAGSDTGGDAMVTLGGGTDFIRGAWTGVWGTVAGFGGAAGSLGDTKAVQAEDEWTVDTQVKYSPLKVQGRTVDMKLDSVSFMIKCKPYGPSHTDIVAALGAHTQGLLLGSADLVLTGPSSKTITLKNAAIKGAGFIFGGTSLGTDEIGFVNTMTFSTGAPASLLEFSV